MVGRVMICCQTAAYWGTAGTLRFITGGIDGLVGGDVDGVNDFEIFMTGVIAIGAGDSCCSRVAARVIACNSA